MKHLTDKELYDKIEEAREAIDATHEAITKRQRRWERQKDRRDALLRERVLRHLRGKGITEGVRVYLDDKDGLFQGFFREIDIRRGVEGVLIDGDAGRGWFPLEQYKIRKVAS